MASFDPGYGETEVSEEEHEALTPFALKVLGEPVLKAVLYDIEQTLQDRVGSAVRFDWDIDRRAYIDALVHYDNRRDITALAELVRVVPA